MDQAVARSRLIRESGPCIGSNCRPYAAEIRAGDLKAPSVVEDVLDNRKADPGALMLAVVEGIKDQRAQKLSYLHTVSC